jgi:hypothetical protein
MRLRLTRSKTDVGGQSDDATRTKGRAIRRPLHVRLGRDGTSIIDAVGTRAECEDRLEAHMKQVNAKRTVDDGSRATAYARIDGVTDRIKYQCLPDTVDPRGPKGK